MNSLQTLLQQFSSVEVMDILDIILVAFLIYILLPVLKSSGTVVRIALVIAIVVAISGLADLLQLHTLHYILSQLLAVGLLAVVVLFQPELRRMLDHMTNLKIRNFFGIRKPEEDIAKAIPAIVSACKHMSDEKVGALIVFARTTQLDRYFKTGTMIEATVTEQLIRNIFFPKAALHDGAMVIRDGRIAAAACVLPLSDSANLSADLGTRHRAAIGMSEVTDAIVVVVSEETGTISLAIEGMLKRHLDEATLEMMLRAALCPEEKNQDENPLAKIYQKLQKKDKGGDDSEK